MRFALRTLACIAALTLAPHLCAQQPPTPDKSPISPPAILTPIYPDTSGAPGPMKGTVGVEFTVDIDGKAKKISVTQGFPVYADPTHTDAIARAQYADRAAVDAVKRARFRPATQDGHPVAVQISLELAFDSE